jgi:hypothetical protein
MFRLVVERPVAPSTGSLYFAAIEPDVQNPRLTGKLARPRAFS